MACCYLLSLPILPPPPQDPRNLGSKEERKLAQASASSPMSDPLPLPAEARDEQTEDRLANGIVMDANILRPGIALETSSSEDSPNVPWIEPYLAQSPAAEENPYNSSLAAPDQLGVGGRKEADCQCQTDQRRINVNDVEAVAERLRAVFELHTSRRLKPAKAASSPRAQKSFSNIRGQATEQQQQQQEARMSVEQGRRRPSFGSGVGKLIRQKSLQKIQNRQRSNSVAPPNNRRPSFNLNELQSHTSLQKRRSSNVETGVRPSLRALGVNPAGRSCIDLCQASPTSTEDRLSGGVQPLSPKLETGADPWASSTSFQTPFESSTLPSPFDETPTRISTGQRLIVFEDDKRARQHRSASRSDSHVPGTSATDFHHSSDGLTFASSLNGEGNGPLSSGKSMAPSPSRNGNSRTHESQRMYHSSSGIPRLSSDSNVGAPEPAEEGPSQLDEEEEPEQPRLAVSIPSQRRWVGYWARMLTNQDPRACLDPLRTSTRRRLVRITRIYIDRRMTAKDAIGSGPVRAGMSSPNGSDAHFHNGLVGSVDNLSIQLGRYDEGLVSRVENWERSARRRTRAFGMLDPSDAAPELSPASWEKDGVDAEALSKRKREQLQKEDDARWESCGRKNSETRTESDKRLAQHGNDRGVGQWGVNVLGEADRVRNFEWDDGPKKGTSNNANNKGASAGQLDYFDLVPEARRQILHGQHALSAMSTIDLQGTQNAASTSTRSSIKRYIFEPGNLSAYQNAASASPWTAKSNGLESHDGEDGPSVSSSNLMSKVTESFRMTRKKSIAAIRPRRHRSDSDSGPNTPSGAASPAHRVPPVPYFSRTSSSDALTAEHGRQRHQSEVDTTFGNSIPCSSYTPRSMSSSNESQGGANAAFSGTIAGGRTPGCRDPSSSNSPTSSASTPPPVTGLVVDADRELLIKVLWGRTGTTHAKLPDWSSAGWIWMIPSFEDPMCCPTASGKKTRVKVGMRTEARFERQEIDFRKKGSAAPGGDVRAIGIEWEWVDVGEENDEDEQTDEELEA